MGVFLEGEGGRWLRMGHLKTAHIRLGRCFLWSGQMLHGWRADSERVKCQASSQTMRPSIFFLKHGASAGIQDSSGFSVTAHKETFISSSNTLPLQFWLLCKTPIWSRRNALAAPSRIPSVKYNSLVSDPAYPNLTLHWCVSITPAGLALLGFDVLGWCIGQRSGCKSFSYPQHDREEPRGKHIQFSTNSSH